MTYLHSDAPRLLPASSAPSASLCHLRPWLKPVRLINPEDHAGNRLLLGLAALTLPSLVYCLVQLWSTISGGTLQEAIRAFAP